MPGMIDTHRHMWQTAMRGYGADWTLTQYFVWYYLEHGKAFRPQDVHAGNLLAGIESLDAGRHHHRRLVARTADHRARRRRRRRAAGGARPVRAGLRQHPGRARGSGRPRRSSGTSSAAGSPPATTCSASRWPSTSPATRRSPRRPPSRSPASSACRSPRTPASGARPTTTASGSCTRTASPTPETIYVHAATLSDDSYHRIAATGGSVSVSTESEQSCGPGLPAHLGAALARHPGLAVDGHQRLVERRPVLGDAHHARRGPVPRAPRGARARATRSPTATCARTRSWSGPPAAAPRRSASTTSSAASRPARRPTWS